MADGGWRGRTRALTRAALLATLCLVVVLAASAVGPWELTPRFSAAPTEEPSTDPTVSADVSMSPPATPEAFPFEDVPAPDLSWLGPVLSAVVVLLLLTLLLRYLAYLRRPVEEPPEPQNRTAGAAPTDAEPDLPVLERGARAAQEYLAQVGEPRDAIVAAWLALEEAAAASGVRRHPAQTPSEFTAGVLTRTSADPGATRTLLALYRRARFGTHPVTTQDVEAAAACLATLAAGWAAVEPGR